MIIFVKNNSYLLLFAVVLCLLSYTMTTVFAENDTYDRAVITVEEGDTLWKLASKYHQEVGMSIQDYIYKIKILNELDSVMIYPGQSIELIVSAN